MKFFLITLISGISLLLSCGSSRPCKDDPKSWIQNTIDIEATINKYNPDNALQIDTAYIEGNQLIAKVIGYNCEDNGTFKCIGDPAIMKSEPPKRMLQIEQSIRTNCSQSTSYWVKIDITELAVTEETGSEITLLLRNYSTPLKYIYQ